MPTRPVYALIVAGGSGARMGSAIPKQFLDLGGKPVLYYSIKAFIETLQQVRVILVVPEGQMAMSRMVLAEFPKSMDVQLVAGGATRYASVAAGLAEVPAGAIVLVHDGARPLVKPDLIRRCYEGACTNGSAVPVVPVADSIREVTGYNSRAIARESLRIVQTPQAFDATILKAAFRQSYLPAFTDEASVVEWTGARVHLVDGEKSNLKITTGEDMVIAAALLAARRD